MFREVTLVGDGLKGAGAGFGFIGPVAGRALGQGGIMIKMIDQE